MPNSPFLLWIGSARFCFNYHGIHTRGLSLCESLWAFVYVDFYVLCERKYGHQILLRGVIVNVLFLFCLPQ